VQCQIKALLHCYGLVIPCRAGRWSAAFEANLWRLRFASELMQRSFEQQLEHYQFLRRQLAEQTKLVRQLAASERYQVSVKQLTTIPGIGVLTAMEILTELGDIARFARAGQLAAYVGLTPSQYSSGAHVRMGHISRCGKAALRGMLVESSWIAIRYDRQLAAVYERLKVRCGGKRAIVAVARRLLLRVRRIWREGRPYQLAA
jgi:transposase